MQTESEWQRSLKIEQQMRKYTAQRSQEYREKRTSFHRTFGNCNGWLMALLLLRNSERNCQRRRSDRQAQHRGNGYFLLFRIQRKTFA